MSGLKKFMSSWEQALNADEELAERNQSPYSTIEGKAAVVLDVKQLEPYTVSVEGGKFSIKKGAAKKPLLCWKVPGDVFKSAMLGEHKLMFSLLDPRNKLIFDTPNFTHWNGATIIEVLLLAQEMSVNNPEISKLVKELEC